MDASAEGIPVGRMGAVEEYKALATSRCSEQAAYVTGARIRIEGGMTRSA